MNTNVSNGADALPELPEAVLFDDTTDEAAYSADQMRTYGEQCRQPLLDEISKLRVQLRLKSRAVDRWVPCPDHRDKTEDGKCYVCENKTLRRRRRNRAGA